MTYASNQEINKKYIKSNRYKFYKIDIRSKKIEDIIKKHKIDLIINFAAESHVDNSIKDPKRFYENNVGGVINLLSIITDKNIRFHQVSTDEVFGSLSLNSKKNLKLMINMIRHHHILHQKHQQIFLLKRLQKPMVLITQAIALIIMANIKIEKN